ncbi:MAG: GGDEF domain-containing protein [Clostridia bacterium]
MNDFICNIFVLIEMLFINLINIDYFCKKKYNKAITFLVYFVTTLFVTIVLIILYVFADVRQINVPIGLMIGLAYIIPFIVLYNDSIIKKVSIIFSSWMYTYTIMAVSTIVAKYFNGNTHSNQLIAQTIIYLITFLPLFFSVRKLFTKLLKNITGSAEKCLLMISICSFLTVFVGNSALINSNNNAIKIATFVVFGIEVFISYAVMMMLTSSKKAEKNLENIIYIDELTGLYNRSYLFIKGEEFIKKNTPFSIIFLDLNYLKLINDTKGHAIGDNYLKLYGCSLRRLLGDKGLAFRISGDEFVCIYMGENELRDKFITDINSTLWDAKLTNIEYLGCGVGYAQFPNESISLDKLISLADSRMYIHKQATKDCNIEK